MKRGVKKSIKLICWMFICMMLTSQMIDAKENPNIVEAYVEGNNITIYVDGMNSNVKKISGMIASNPCEKVSYDKVDNRNNNIKTLILVDSSKSITDKERSKFKELVLDLIDHKSNNESFCIASYGTEIKYLSKFVQDRYELLKAYEKIQYKKHSSYLTDVVAQANDNLDAIKDNSLKRIIIFSDGYDNNPDGITKEELYNRLDSSSYPIYTVGCIHEDNNDSLKEFFALSRKTGAKSYKIEKKTKTSKVRDSIFNTKGYLRINIMPGKELQDGSIKTLELTIETDRNTYELKKDIRMNMIKKEKVVEKAQPVVSNKSEKDMNSKFFTSTNIIIMVVGSILIIALSIVIGVLIGKNKANKIRINEKNSKNKKPDIIISGGKNISDQEFASNIGRSFKSAGEDLDKTVILPQSDDFDKTMTLTTSKSQWSIKLKDINNSRIFVKELKNELIIGRMGSINDPTRIILDYESSVSKKHCRIFIKEEKICIEDMGSSNCTYLNGAVVNGQVNLNSGDVIGIGKLRLQVGIEKL